MPRTSRVLKIDTQPRRRASPSNAGLKHRLPMEAQLPVERSLRQSVETGTSVLIHVAIDPLSPTAYVITVKLQSDGSQSNIGEGRGESLRRRKDSSVRSSRLEAGMGAKPERVPLLQIEQLALHAEASSNLTHESSGSDQQTVPQQPESEPLCSEENVSGSQNLDWQNPQGNECPHPLELRQEDGDTHEVSCTDCGEVVGTGNVVFGSSNRGAKNSRSPEETETANQSSHELGSMDETGFEKNRHEVRRLVDFLPADTSKDNDSGRSRLALEPGSCPPSCACALAKSLRKGLAEQRIAVMIRRHRPLSRKAVIQIAKYSQNYTITLLTNLLTGGIIWEKRDPEDTIEVVAEKIALVEEWERTLSLFMSQ